MQRSSGILLPLSALPGRYGIGSLGREAYRFVDFLSAAGQRWWQLLPVGPTSYGDSPYQSFSTYAGNPYFIDLDELCREKLLRRAELEAIDWGADAARVDYGAIYRARFDVLARACERGWDRYASEIAAYEAENAGWLPDYALFMALKRENGMVSWLDWPDEDLRLRRPEALDAARLRCAADIRLFVFIQFLFDRQWRALRAYAHEKGVYLFGDLPIYVALDSADVWAEPEQFLLEEDGTPSAVAGVPPDYFSADGQLWGNPLYNWEKMKDDGYNWWIRRLDGAGARFDMIRIDHFRGLEQYWSVPWGAKTAAEGHWEPGPGLPFVQVLTSWFPQLGIVAEDLGVDSPGLKQLLKDSGLPGMKVLQFAFQTRAESPHQPHTYPRSCICYVGTHDNDTALGWAKSAPRSELAFAREYLGCGTAEPLGFALIRAGMRSVADLFIAPMQDYLQLGASARINTPGTLGGNWCWRMLPGQASGALARRIRRLSETYGRCEKV